MLMTAERCGTMKNATIYQFQDNGAAWKIERGEKHSQKRAVWRVPLGIGLGRILDSISLKLDNGWHYGELELNSFLTKPIEGRSVTGIASQDNTGRGGLAIHIAEQGG